MSRPLSNETKDSATRANDWLEIVRSRVENLRFGTVQITVHDGKVTQVESIEKTRIVPPKDLA